MKRIKVLWFLVLLYACNTPASSGYNPAKIYIGKPRPLQIDNSNQSWGTDMKISIVTKKQSDASVEYEAISNYRGRPIGLIVTIPGNTETANGFGSGMELKSLGDPSNYLLETLSMLYQLPYQKTFHFPASLYVNYVNLDQFTRSIMGKAQDSTLVYRYKIFFESDNDYAELYVDIDNKRQWLELKEKDPGYRKTILDFLTKR